MERNLNMPFVKLDTGILQSSIWCEDSDTRVVWITMLAMSDSTGSVKARAPGIASMAQISLVKTVRALNKLAQPDKYSRTTNEDGRRIRETEDGFEIVNYEKYRSYDHTGAERQRRFRAKNKPQTVTRYVTGGNVTVTEADTDTDKSKKETPLPLFPDPLKTAAFDEAWNEWAADRRERRLKPYTTRGAAKLLKRLAGLGSDRAVAAIEHSITHGYQGVYEAKNGKPAPDTAKLEHQERVRAEKRENQRSDDQNAAQNAVNLNDLPISHPARKVSR
jgi:hypothetical protein